MQVAQKMVAIFALAGAAYIASVPKDAVPPKPSEQAHVSKPVAAPKHQRSTDHRKTHRTAPKITKRKWEPLPKIKPIPPIMKEEKSRRAAKPRPKALPSCAEIKRRRDSMTFAEQLAAYSRATPEEVAHGRRCLGI